MKDPNEKSLFGKELINKSFEEVRKKAIFIKEEVPVQELGFALS